MMTDRLSPLTLSLLLLLAGCGERSTNSVVLKFWTMGREGEVLRELIAEFQQRHPQIRVRLQQMPWTAAHEKLLTAYAGDATPDICQLGNTWVSEFVALRALEDLTPFVEESDAVSRDDYFPGVWDTNVVAGAVYGVPWYVDTRVLFYRKDILREAGFRQPPKTWKAWLEAMRRIKERVGPENYAILLPMNEWAPPVVLSLQTGAELLRDGDQYGNFRSPEFRRAFQFYIGLFEAGLAPPINNTEISNIWNEFSRGYFSMYITGPWNIGEFQRRLPPEMEGNWSTAPMPAPVAGKPGASLAGGSSLALFRASRHKREAWQLIEFLSQPEAQVRFHELSGNLPARESCWDHPLLAENQYAAAFRLQLEHVVPLPQVPEIERICTKILQAVEAAVTKGLAVEEVLLSLDQEVDAILGKRRWMLSSEGNHSGQRF